MPHPAPTLTKRCRHALLGCLSVLLLAGAPLAADNAYNGKLYCSAVRCLPLEFPGVADALCAAPGDRVHAGQIILRYTLAESARRALQAQLYAEGAADEPRMRLLQTEREQTLLEEKLESVRRLAREGLGAPGAARRLERQADTLERQKTLFANMLRARESAFAAHQNELYNTLGFTKQQTALDTLARNGLPDKAVLRTPVDGLILQVNIALHPGTAFSPMPWAVSVGTTDPMLARAPV